MPFQSSSVFGALPVPMNSYCGSSAPDSATAFQRASSAFAGSYW
jgi:hypothetical protein